MNPRKKLTVADTYENKYENCNVEIWFPHRQSPISTKTDVSFSGYFDMYQINANKWGTINHLEEIHLVVNNQIEVNIKDMWEKYDICNRCGMWVVKDLYEMECHIYVETHKGEKYKFIGCFIVDYKGGIASFKPAIWCEQ